MRTALLWYKSDGTELAFGEAFASGATYYAKIPVGSGFNGFGADFEWDASVIVTFTIDGCNDPDAALTEATGASWKNRAAVGSIVVPGGSASSDGFEVSGRRFDRYRAKAVVGGTGGRVTGWVNQAR